VCRTESSGALLDGCLLVWLLCDKFQVQDPLISSRLTLTERYYPDPLSPFLYESQLFVGNALFSDTGQFTCSYVMNGTETPAQVQSSKHAIVYIYVFGRLHSTLPSTCVNLYTSTAVKHSRSSVN